MSNYLNLDSQIKGSRPPFYGTDSGATNAYAVTTTAPLGPTLRTGSIVIFIAANGNTGASTLAVNGGSAIPIKKAGTTALASGDIATGQAVAVIYDGTNFQLLAGGSTGGGGTPGGSDTEIQYNNSGSFDGIDDGSEGQVLTSNGAGAVPSFQDLPPVNFPPGPNMLISGGGVVWTGGLNFTVSAATYIIGGVLYTSPQTNVTLSAADPTNDRIDIIAVDSSSTVQVITGIPSGTPAAPDVDPATQLELTFVSVPASSTTPGSISEVDLYLENAEYTSATNAAGHINLASTSNPFQGSKDIEATGAVTGDYITLTKPSGSITPGSYTGLSLNIRLKASWPKAKSLSLFWLNGSAIVGNAVGLKGGIFGLDNSNTTGYQQIVIPISSFAVGSSSVTALKIQVTGSGSSIGFYLDNVILQSAITGGGSGGSGTVTSVGLSMPAEFSVSGSPVTTAGTLAVSKANQSANQVYAGPTGGGAAAPGFRALVAADIPNIAESQVTNLTTDLAAKVPTSRTISTTAPLTGGGDLSANRTLDISNFTGDSGSGGAKGTVPAPAAGDAAAGKFLKADGTWAAPTGGGGTPGGSNHQVQINSSGSFAGLATGTAGQVLTSNGAAADPSFQTPSASINFADGEDLSSSFSGSPSTATLAHTPLSGSLKLYVDGSRQRVGAGNDYTLSGATVTFAITLAAGTIVLADYRY